MTRKLLAWLVAALLLLSLATYVYYRRTLAARPVDPYALVPADAVLVLATRDHPALVRHLQEAGVWDKLTGTRYAQQVAGLLALADSLDSGGRPAGRRRGLLDLLGQQLVLTSWHQTGPGQVDVLFQLPLGSVPDYRRARALLEALGRDPRYALSTRRYEGYDLQVLTARAGGVLTVLNYRNHLVLSTCPALVEAVVQRLRQPAAPTVRAGFGPTDPLRLREVDATLLVNFRRLPGLLDGYFQPGTHRQLDQAAGLAGEALLGVKFGPGQLTLSGFANPDPAGAWQQQLAGQPAEPLRPLADVLPLRAALVLAVGGQLRRPAPGSAGADPDSASYSSAGQVGALDSLRAGLWPGAALVYLATPAPGVAPAVVALLRCRVPARTARWLARLRRLGRVSPAFGRVGRAELYAAGFSENQLLGELTPLEVSDGRGGPARPRCTALVGGYLALGDEPTLRAYLAEVAAGQVWSHSAAQVALLQQAQPQARLTVLADLRQGWNALLGSLAEAHRADLLRNESLLRQFPQVAWQLVPPAAATEEAHAGSEYFAQLLLRRPGQVPAAGPVAGVVGGAVVRFRTALAGVPLVLPAAETSPGGGRAAAPAVLVADSGGVLRRLAAGPGSPAWADSLPGPVVGAGPRLVRGRLLLATAHRLHWLSPTDGREAPGFPLNLPDSVSIAAVAGSAGSARLVVATAAQDLLLFDTSGRRYPGWPHRLEAPLAGPPLLLSVAGRDVVVAALTNGYVYAFDQAGGRYPGFPVSAGARLAGPALATVGATLAGSTLRLVNQHGELLTLSLSGDVLARRRVATWSRTASFRLVPAEAGGAVGSGGSFVVVRQDGGQLDVFGAGGGPPLLSQRLLTSGDKPVQWFDFGAANQVLALTEPLPGQVRLFDGAGRPLGSGAAWPSTGPGVALRFDAAARRYVLLRYVRRELRQEEVSLP